MDVYAVKHKDENVINASRSGGAFTAISDFVLRSGGVVYGCVLDENFAAVHIRATSAEQRDQMRGSKYVQSHLGLIFQDVLNDLKNGKIVLFSGTPCQVAGLKKLLSIKNQGFENLLCVDIACQGVPSPIVWERYLQWERRNKQITSVNFRDKIKFGWRDTIQTIAFENESVSNNVYSFIFYNGCALRPSCYECHYKSVQRPGDITLADYWGIETVAPEFDDNKGVSLVLVNTEHGKDIFQRIKGNIIWKETTLESAMQRAFIRPERKPENREQFWRDFATKNFSFIARKYGGHPSKVDYMIQKVKQAIKWLLRRGKGNEE